MTIDPHVFGELRERWGWLLALGILLVIFGTIGLGMEVVLTIASVLVYGVLALIGGVLQIVQAFRSRGWKSATGHALIGVLYVVAGIVIWDDPVMASAVLTLVIAAALLAVGAVRIVVAIQHRGMQSWGWLLFGGIVAILLGLIIAAHWPVSGLWVIGTFVAIEMLFNGWSLILVALAAKNAPATGAPLPHAPATA